MTDSPLKGTVVLVATDPVGSGSQAARALAQHGATIALVYRDAFTAARDLVRAIEDDGGHAIAVKADIRDAGQDAFARAKVTAILGRIDLVVLTETGTG
jgi:3-oxoacyl-[acyl-carrier protein] reductase